MHNVGRKNYLFCGSHEAAKRAGLLYSLLVSCKLNNVNPYEWLKDVLSHNINELTTSKLKSLLPHRWKKQESNTAA
ncbi:transposase [Niastella koreensis]|uniref:Transposase n=1 Tax=Niastella koreensis TaxID=354356 RepID=A0ABX3P0Y7_9BACT|nr:transposase [Niastella koreensis]